MGILTKSSIEYAPVSLNRGAGVDVARRTDHFGDLGQRHLFGQISIVGIIEMVHTRLPSPDPRDEPEFEPPGVVRWTL